MKVTDVIERLQKSYNMTDDDIKAALTSGDLYKYKRIGPMTVDLLRKHYGMLAEPTTSRYAICPCCYTMIDTKDLTMCKSV